MKVKEIRDKQTAAIELEMKDLQKHLFELRTQAVTEKLENPSLLRKTRKDIAQMKTILRERQLEGQKKSEGKTKEKAKAE
jgi:large subunit ribosomal protein L29